MSQTDDRQTDGIAMTIAEPYLVTIRSNVNNNNNTTTYKAP